MMNVLEYKGYSARVELDPEDECFVGRLAGINDVVGFHGSTIAEIKAAFHEAVDDYVETCRKANKTPERPYSGKVMFRIAPEVHARAALAAQLKGVSLNQWAEEVISEAATVASKTYRKRRSPHARSTSKSQSALKAWSNRPSLR